MHSHHIAHHQIVCCCCSHLHDHIQTCTWEPSQCAVVSKLRSCTFVFEYQTTFEAMVASNIHPNTTVGPHIWLALMDGNGERASGRRVGRRTVRIIYRFPVKGSNLVSKTRINQLDHTIMLLPAQHTVYLHASMALMNLHHHRLRPPAAATARWQFNCFLEKRKRYAVSCQPNSGSSEHFVRIHHTTSTVVGHFIDLPFLFPLRDNPDVNIRRKASAAVLPLQKTRKASS